MKINNLPKEEVLRNLVTSEKGLTEEEARKRLLEFGPNEIREVRKKPLVLKFQGSPSVSLQISKGSCVPLYWKKSTSYPAPFPVEIPK